MSTKQLHPKYTRSRQHGNRSEVYDSEARTWIPLWIALGYMNYQAMVDEIGEGATGVKCICPLRGCQVHQFGAAGGADTYDHTETSGGFDGGGGDGGGE